MLGRISLLGVLLTTFVAAVAGAESNDTAMWGQVGGWEIRVDRTVGDGCFAMQVFERGTVVRIGFDRTTKTIYLIFGHNDWKSLEEDKVYPVRIRFDNAQDYNGEMQGQRLAKTVFLVQRNLNKDFVMDFMQRNSMEIFYRDQRIASVSLRNTYAAVGEVIKCQREIGTAGAQPRAPDPFAGTPANRSRDPFE